MKKFLKILTGRLAVFIFLVLVQIAVLIWLTINLVEGSGYYFTLMYALSFLVVFFVVSRDDNPAFKISWIIVIMAVPVFGVPFYMFFGNKRGGSDLPSEWTSIRSIMKRKCTQCFRFLKSR